MADLAHQLAAHPAWVWREGMRACAPDGYDGLFYWRVHHGSAREVIAAEEETGVVFRWSRHDDGWRVSARRTAIVSTGPARGLVDSEWVPVPVGIHRPLHKIAVPDLTDDATAGILLAELARSGARPHVRYRERDVEVIVGVRERGMDGARARRVRLTGATAGEALARAVVEVVRG